MPNGDGGGFDFGSLFDSLLGTLADAVNAIISFLQQLVGAIVNALNFLFAGEQALGIFSFDGLAQLWKILKKVGSLIWDAVLHKALIHLWELYQKLQAFVRKLKVWLDRFHALQRKYQVAAFRRVINLIQRARKILLIFRIFHFKFAKKLDGILTHIESLIIRREFDIARKMNEVIGWMNVILDPKRGLTHLPVFLAAGKSADAVLVLFTGRGLDYWYSKKPAAGYGVGQPITYAQHYAELDNQLAAGSGDVGAWRANFSVWQDLTKQVR